MKNQLERQDVYYDLGDGEYQPLSSDLARQLAEDVEIAIHANPHYEHSVMALSRHAKVMVSECTTIDSVRDGEGVEVLREKTITCCTLYRDRSDVEEMQTVSFTEQQHARRLQLAMATEHVGELTERMTSSRFADRYIIERYIDGTYQASVEQLDMSDPQARRTKRPMTLYDGVELLRQIEQSTQV